MKDYSGLCEEMLRSASIELPTLPCGGNNENNPAMLIIYPVND